MNVINSLHAKSLKFIHTDLEFYSLPYSENFTCNLVTKPADFYVNTYIFVE